MTDRFDLEQQIMNCWNITEDIKLLNTYVLEGKPEGGEMTTDEVSNFLLGLETIYGMKFDQMYNTFSTLVNTKQI
jgi:hypothetical protein